MFSHLPSILMYFNQLRPTLPILSVSRQSQCSLLPVYGITKGWSILWPMFIYLRQLTLLTSSALPNRFQNETWRMLHHHSFDVNMERQWCTSKVDTVTCLQSALHKRLELLHTHTITVSSCLVLDSSPAAQTLGITFPKQLGGAPENKVWILDFTLATKLEIKNTQSV